MVRLFVTLRRDVETEVQIQPTIRSAPWSGKTVGRPNSPPPELLENESTWSS